MSKNGNKIWSGYTRRWPPKIKLRQNKTEFAQHNIRRLFPSRTYLLSLVYGLFWVSLYLSVRSLGVTRTRKISIIIAIFPALLNNAVRLLYTQKFLKAVSSKRARILPSCKHLDTGSTFPVVETLDGLPFRTNRHDLLVDQVFGCLTP